jgi:hypothetical protein
MKIVSKSPFKKVPSMIERKKILGQSIGARSRILMKGSDGSLIFFEPMYQFSDGSLEGQIYEHYLKSNPHKVLVLVTIQKERYFLNTTMSRTEHGWKLNITSDFYVLNRRNGFRVAVPKSAGMKFQLSYASGTTKAHYSLPILEISVGGARIMIPPTLKVKKNSILRGTIEWQKTRNLQVEATVLHSPSTFVWGVKFTHTDTITANRLKMLAVEIQQNIY